VTVLPGTPDPVSPLHLNDPNLPEPSLGGSFSASKRGFQGAYFLNMDFIFPSLFSSRIPFQGIRVTFLPIYTPHCVVGSPPPYKARSSRFLGLITRAGFSFLTVLIVRRSQVLQERHKPANRYFHSWSAIVVSRASLVSLHL